MLRILTSFLATFLLSCCILFSKTDVKNVVVDIKPNDSGITEENGGKVKSSIKALLGDLGTVLDNLTI